MTATLANLRLPKEDFSTQVAGHFTSKEKLHDWLISQPHAQPLDLSRNLHDALFTLNRTRIDRDLRLQLNELFLQSINMHLPALQLIYKSSTVTNNPRASSAWKFARDLFIELGFAFKLSLIEEVNRRFGMSNRQTARLIARIMDLEQRLLILCYQAYYPLPEGIWLDCHTLFYFALQHKLLDELPREEPLHIVPLYKETLLLGLCDPYSLLHGEIEQVRDWLQKLANHAVLQSVEELFDPSGFFLIKLDEDNAPQFMGQRPQELTGHHTLLLNCFDLVRRMYRELAPLEKVAASSNTYYRATQHIDLLRRLIRSWGIAPKRVFNRMRNNATVILVSELSTVHRVLTSSKVQPAPSTDFDDLSDVIPDFIPSPSPGSIAVSEETHSLWKVINVSAGGYALQLISEDIGLISVGRIVILKSDTGDKWNVAAVRWVRLEEHVEIGLQLLAPEAETIMIRPVIHATGTQFEPGLLLPAVQELRQPASILAPAGFFAPLREFEILRGPYTLTVRSVRRMTQGLCVDQFEFITPAEVEALMEMPYFDSDANAISHRVA
ncbi:hypothetical protein [Leeia oryzae]|uniref:hypothetical protein n=1 Tax=Leeia oryzae TaxID=356662 RepID=UPI00036CCCEB|nr:hypothetical protein [Leeia oryzae]